ncbi:AraC family ligand binding domain-containing protein, partial [Frankia sp. AvcI1]
GTGVIRLGDADHDVQPGDILYTAAGIEHDVLAVTGDADLYVFWLSWALPDGASGLHLHRIPADAAGHRVPYRPSA